MSGMRTNTNNMTKPCFLPRRCMVAAVSFLLAGNLSPFGMRLLDSLNVEPPWSDVALSIVLFVISGIIYCLICPKRRKMI